MGVASGSTILPRWTESHLTNRFAPLVFFSMYCPCALIAFLLRPARRSRMARSPYPSPKALAGFAQRCRAGGLCGFSIDRLIVTQRQYPPASGVSGYFVEQRFLLGTFDGSEGEGLRSR